MEGEATQIIEFKDEIVQLFSHLNHLYDSHSSLQTQVNFLTQRVLMLEATASPTLAAEPIVAIVVTEVPASKAVSRSQKRKVEKEEGVFESYTP